LIWRTNEPETDKRIKRQDQWLDYLNPNITAVTPEHAACRRKLSAKMTNVIEQIGDFNFKMGVGGH
jgi:hypothetical protein